MKHHLEKFARVFITATFKFKSYAPLVGDTLKYALGYFLALNIIVSGVFVAVEASRFFAYEYGPLTDSLDRAKSAVINQIEDDLEIKFTNGSWTINKAEPYQLINVREVLREAGMSEEDLKEMEEAKLTYLATFDKNGTLEDLESRESLILVNEKNYIVREQNEGYRATPLRSMEFTLTKPLVTDFLNSLTTQKLTIFFGTIYFLALTVMFIISVGFRLMGLGVLALLLWFAANLMAKTDTMGKFENYLKIAIYAETLPILLVAVLSLVKTDFNPPIFVLNLGLALLAMNWYVRSTRKRDEVPQNPEDKPKDNGVQNGDPQLRKLA